MTHRTVLRITPEDSRQRAAPWRWNVLDPSRCMKVVILAAFNRKCFGPAAIQTVTVISANDQAALTGWTARLIKLEGRADFLPRRKRFPPIAGRVGRVCPSAPVCLSSNGGALGQTRPATVFSEARVEPMRAYQERERDHEKCFQSYHWTQIGPIYSVLTTISSNQTRLTGFGRATLF